MVDPRPHPWNAAGDIFVSALDVGYTTPGGAKLFGTIAGVGGGRAASLGFADPAINNNYLFNGCPSVRQINTRGSQRSHQAGPLSREVQTEDAALPDT